MINFLVLKNVCQRPEQEELHFRARLQALRPQPNRDQRDAVERVLGVREQRNRGVRRQEFIDERGRNFDRRFRRRRLDIESAGPTKA